MPDARLARARATLPTGYQFGDAGLDRVFGDITPDSRAVLSLWARNRLRLEAAERRWRAMHENAGAELRRKATPVCLHSGARYDIVLLAWVCRCGARLEDHAGIGHWNVIEGDHH